MSKQTYRHKAEKNNTGGGRSLQKRKTGCGVRGGGGGRKGGEKEDGNNTLYNEYHSCFLHVLDVCNGIKRRNVSLVV